MSIHSNNALGRLAERVVQNPQPAAPRPPPPSAEKPGSATVSVDARTYRSQADHLSELETELAAANSKLAGEGREVRFEYDRNVNRVIVRLIDVATEKVLRQYPSDEALRVARQVKSGKSLVNLQV